MVPSRCARSASSALVARKRSAGWRVAGDLLDDHVGDAERIRHRGFGRLAAGRRRDREEARMQAALPHPGNIDVGVLQALAEADPLAHHAAWRVDVQVEVQRSVRLCLLSRGRLAVGLRRAGPSGKQRCSRESPLTSGQHGSHILVYGSHRTLSIGPPPTPVPRAAPRRRIPRAGRGRRCCCRRAGRAAGRRSRHLRCRSARTGPSPADRGAPGRPSRLPLPR
jgi:hypothetical protein